MSFVVRPSSTEDLPNILELFKTSLGEEGGIPTIPFWKWKHELNPFGKSPILLAWDGDTLVGLRAFLCWRFRNGNETILGYRPVDTATHPAYRGRGIFKKLTLQMINDLEVAAPSFVFNTPNKQSKPGYLNMGWSEVGKTPLKISSQPFNWIKRKIVAKDQAKPNGINDKAFAEIESLINQTRSIYKEVIHTDYNLEYLNWRYHLIPGITYQFHRTELKGKTCLIFYRLKKGRLFELRITDILISDANKQLLNKCIDEIVQLHLPDVITLLVDGKGLLNGLLPLKFIDAKRFGLMITGRNVNSVALEQLFQDQKNWYLSGGTLELF